MTFQNGHPLELSLLQFPTAEKSMTMRMAALPELANGYRDDQLNKQIPFPCTHSLLKKGAICKTKYCSNTDLSLTDLCKACVCLYIPMVFSTQRHTHTYTTALHYILSQ